jgi:uncharacterized pyridoxamine 5'-phosphate oxidase family protein
MNKINRLKNTIRNITSEELFGILATSVNDVPYTNLIAFVLQDDLKKLFFATPRDTKKFKNIIANKKISFHVHNSKNSYEDTGNAIGITITGRAFEYSKENSEKVKDLYLLKHPQMKEFFYAINIAFISVDIERYDVVEKFQNVTVLKMNEQVVKL